MKHLQSVCRAICLSASFGVALMAPVAVHAADPWRYGVVEAKGDAGLIFMPSRFGDKYGLDIQMVQFTSSTTPVKALISGDIDAFTTSPGVALVAMSRNAALKFVGCNWQGATTTLYGASDIKTMADLKGRASASPASARCRTCSAARCGARAASRPMTWPSRRISEMSAESNGTILQGERL